MNYQHSYPESPSKIPLVVALLAIVIAIGAFFVSTSGSTSNAAGGIGGKTATAGEYIAGLGFGVGTESSFKTVFNSSGQLTLSTTGTPVTRINFGSCNVIAYASTIAASTTAQVDCGTTGAVGGTLTGVTTGDSCDVYATSTLASSPSGVLLITGSIASTTPGYCVIKLFNGTGGTFTWTGAASSSMVYQDFR